MIKRFLYLLGVSAVAVLSACSSGHFLKEEAYRKQVETDFAEKQKVFQRGGLFDIFNEQLTAEEREALMFLYAYMPGNDMADYPGEFFLENVQSSLQCRKEASWGKDVPDREFRHFVLPIRVNNENMDSSRVVFHRELWPRVKDLSMLDAVLEVNHWCHEKVVYTPSDGRTSSPLASVRTAYGRCGEESTFLVAALRSVGIPARQVYTPRWAHTDDNHAWVEAWVDGKWHFMGACEPEPVLDLGWFNAPASRGMLMHTKVFGNYDGPEDVMKKTANYTEINVIDNYAESAPVQITVTDADGKPVSGADVEFKVYNYAEFYTVARKTADAQGHASLSAGLGDMLVYAAAGGKYGFKKVSFGKDKQLAVVLDHREGDGYALPVDIVPPPEKVKLPEVTPEQRAENTRRMEKEDSIRNAYVATFPTEAQAKDFAREIQADEATTVSCILKSRGNYAEIMRFLKNAAGKQAGERAFALLSTLSDKDFRDTPCSVLEDHLYHTSTSSVYPPDTDVRKVLAPRIGMELLTPYRSFLQKEVPAAEAEAFRQDLQVLVKWCKDSLDIRDDLNTGATIESPAGVWKSRVADKRSRDVFFVAMARSLGVAAWIDEVNGNIYYMEGKGKRVQVDFDATQKVHPSEGTLKAVYKPIPRLDNPKYYTHFTLSKYDNGSFRLLNFPEDATWKSLLKNGTTIETGYYMLVTGSRMADGGVLGNVTFFTVSQGKTTTVDLVMRDNAEEIRVIGNFNSENLYRKAGTDEQVSVLSTTGRGYFVIGVLGVGQEPTNHALKDIEVKKAEFEKWGRSVILLFTDEDSYRKFDPKDFPNLPSTVTFGIDADGKIRKEIAENMKLANGGHLPVFIIGDTFNRVVFESHGYTIGLGERLIHVIQGL